MSGDEFERVRPEIAALVRRGNITPEELKTIRCNSWEHEALVPAMTDEAFVERMQYALDNCFTTRERPFSTYNQAVEGLYAPELLTRFASLGDKFAEATKKWQTYEREYILPCFEWAKDEGRDLQQEVLNNPGKNCVELFFKLRRGKCQACSIEAEIGTKENPHPVPERFHTCPPIGATGRRP